MQEPEGQQSSRPSSRSNGHRRPIGSDSPDLRGAIGRRSQEAEARSEETVIDDEETGSTTFERPSLPPNGLWYALILGVIGGVLSIVINIAITLANASLFERVAREGSNVAYGTALNAVGLQCLSFIISLAMSFFSGYVIGRTVIQRRLGFYAGVITGAIFYLSSFVTHFIPNYPGNISSGTSSTVGAYAGSLIVIIIFLLIIALFNGLFGLWGTSFATRKHPYYARREEEE